MIPLGGCDPTRHRQLRVTAAVWGKSDEESRAFLMGSAAFLEGEGPLYGLTLGEQWGTALRIASEDHEAHATEAVPA